MTRRQWCCALILIHHHPIPASHCPDKLTPVTPLLKVSKLHFFVAWDMSDQSESSQFETLFESALHDYEKQTGIPLDKHPLAEQLQNCQSVDSVATLIQEQARAFNEFRGSDKIMKSLKSVVSSLSRVSAVANLGHDLGMVCPWPLIGFST